MFTFRAKKNPDKIHEIIQKNTSQQAIMAIAKEDPKVIYPFMIKLVRETINLNKSPATGAVLDTTLKIFTEVDRLQRSILSISYDIEGKLIPILEKLIRSLPDIPLQESHRSLLDELILCMEGLYKQAEQKQFQITSRMFTNFFGVSELRLAKYYHDAAEILRVKLDTPISEVNAGKDSHSANRLSQDCLKRDGLFPQPTLAPTEKTIDATALSLGKK